MKNTALLIILFLVSLSCQTLKIDSQYITRHADTTPSSSLSDFNKNKWQHLDPVDDSVPGMSVEKAYNELIKNQKGEVVIVAVLDSGIDIDHDDLKENIWKNNNEIPGNKIDDDNNGFIDDIYGWNYLGEAYFEQLELTRLLGKGTDFPEKEEAQKDYDKRFANARSENIKKYYLNFDFRGRTTGDDPDNFDDVDYGDNNVKHIRPDESHGTHVAGIIAASRNNGFGIDGVANNVKIMSLRVVPYGDEYDKDVALGIKYAADNGAHIINTSFGKGFSPHSDKVREAIAYAASKDVLIVNAAGNDNDDLDVVPVYPNDSYKNGPEVSDNFISVGALNPYFGKYLKAGFSNYGKINVDVFAPGVNIRSLIPENKYDSFSGTSMASPGVAGVAAVLKSYFPKLKANELKKILIESGIKVNSEIRINSEIEKEFGEISKSGKIVNLYNALIYASKKQYKK